MSFFRNLMFLLAVTMPLLMSGCPKKPKLVSCKADSECRFDASGKEVNGFCHNGQCQECVKDTDCNDLKQCVEGRCLAACQNDADCGLNSHCDNNFCKENCTSDDACPAGEMCHQGRCMAKSASFDNGEAKVNADCKNLGKIYFDFDSSELKGENQEMVSKLGQCMKENPSLELTIAGHTDDRGTPSYNQILGLQRADAVKKNLVSAWGIASARIKTISYGDQQPEMKESTEYAWKQNRRAEISWLQN
jgi:outer membrane protein OmpA-like peptidoglycan-associated protein